MMQRLYMIAGAKYFYLVLRWKSNKQSEVSFPSIRTEILAATL